MQVIKVENLSKRYALGGTRHNSLRDVITGVFRRDSQTDEKKILWALRDVSFSVKDGETLGIIGNNGAGKSTLLKILSRITKPTGGEATIHGRVGSLLEVGTGFHNELTGRENVYLNGAILGMKRVEIQKRFDEIVAFAEVEKFLDTPIKFYSSGMFMRLAFAVAANLNPEILIVDEVLAVGDMAFQKKCLGKMQEVGQQGRTVLFVSHDMQAVTRLCQRIIWMQNGKVFQDGEAQRVIGDYLNAQSKTGAEKTWEPAEAPGNEIVKLLRVRMCDTDNKTVSTVDIKEPVYVEITYEVLQDGKVLMPNFQLYNDRGTCVFVSQDLDEEWRHRSREKGVYVSCSQIPGNLLAEGTFFVSPAATTYEPMNVHFSERDAVVFFVNDSFDSDSARGDYGGLMSGVVRPLLSWETKIIHQKNN